MDVPFQFGNLFPELQEQVLSYCDTNVYAKFAQTSSKTNELFEKSSRWQNACMYVYPEKLKPEDRSWKMHFKTLFRDQGLKRVYIHTLQHTKYSVKYEDNGFTGAHLRRLFEQEYNLNTTPDQMRFIFAGKQICVDTVLSSFRIDADEDLYFLKRQLPAS
jgi:hypothetical protein